MDFPVVVMDRNSPADETSDFVKQKTRRTLVASAAFIRCGIPR
jgi:hypothetical protein